ncbi:helix-turn-helix domain-containing protein [Catalinimonas niigatensis]|uniref:helix-turn-helix domain-containing protein n=1 Tax=Catalinimonas niigatensis TaxID=1397264 RepID=UPI0026662C3D|nr:helix-turn-helix domain-containing protein [Catalinimonas niigatensis]WPP51372.1 helix-turn-helix domain-containing protein [Catalinimonas niigatensis]
MIYEKFQPAAALQPYVMCYYILEHSHYISDAVELHLPPSGLAGLVFNYEDAAWVLHANGKSTQVPHCFIAGQFKRNYSLQLKGKVGMLGVVFWPAALPRLFGIPMIEFTEKRVDLSLIIGHEAEILRQQILACEHPLSRIRILEQYLLHKLYQVSPSLDIVDCAVKTILDQRGILSIRQLSDDLHISSRQFCRRFTEKVGITPKRFARIKRFNYISQLVLADSNEWLDVVFEGGYYDQSHFIRDFCEFSGKNPSEFMNYKRKLSHMMEG